MDPSDRRSSEPSKAWTIILPVGVAVVVWFVVVVTATLVTFILPESFASSARVKVERGQSADTQARQSRGGNDSDFIPTECGVIGSEAVLGKVIEDLDLNAAWGRKYAGGAPLKTSETLMLVKGRMDVRPISNTRLIEIRVFSEKPQEAALIANAVAKTYQTRALETHTVVEIIDRAVPGLHPVRPNKPLNIALGFVLGVVFGLAAGGLVFLAQRFFRRQKTQLGGSAQFAPTRG